MTFFIQYEKYYNINEYLHKFHKMKYFSVLLYFLLISSSIVSQNIDIIYEDNFNNNNEFDKNWWHYDVAYELKNKQITCMSKNSGYLHNTTNYTGIDKSSLSMVLTFKKLSGDDTSFFGLNFNNTEYILGGDWFFHINTNGVYKIGKYRRVFFNVAPPHSNYSYEDYRIDDTIIRQEKTDLINLFNKMNKLSVDVINDKILFFINDHFLCEVNKSIFPSSLFNYISITHQKDYGFILRNFKISKDDKLFSIENLFIESFIDNNNDWHEYRDRENSVFINKGKLNFIGENDPQKELSITSPKEIYIDKFQDFVIQIRFKTENSNFHIQMINENSQVFSLSPIGDKKSRCLVHFMNVNIDTVFSFIQLINHKADGNYYKKKHKVQDDVNINMNEYNELEIRRINGVLSIILNSDLLLHLNDAVFPFLSVKLGASSINSEKFKLYIDKYLEIRLNRENLEDIVGPDIIFTYPSIGDKDEIQYQSVYDSIWISGNLEDKSGIRNLFLNGKEINVNLDGTFKIPLKLIWGLNNLKFEATDVFGNQTVKQIKIYFSKIVPQNGCGINNFGGRNFLVLIAIDDYKYINKLHSCINDANGIKKLLLSDYIFCNDYLWTYYDSLATIENLTSMFDSLAQMLGPNDNLVIFYTGHGWYNKHLEQGYWIPVNARIGVISDLMTDVNIISYIKSIKTKHTLIFVDACFSGSIFEDEAKDSYAGKIEKNPSRYAITSGRIEKVISYSDGSGSPFTKSIITYLSEKDIDMISVSDLSQYVIKEVANQNKQTPRGGHLKINDDKGGEFIFYKKKKIIKE